MRLILTESFDIGRFPVFLSRAAFLNVKSRLLMTYEAAYDLESTEAVQRFGSIVFIMAMCSHR